MPGKIRFGMVGTGFIADWVLAGARQDARFEAVAICSRSQERVYVFLVLLLYQENVRKF